MAMIGRRGRGGMDWNWIIAPLLGAALCLSLSLSSDLSLSLFFSLRVLGLVAPFSLFFSFFLAKI